MRVLGQLLVVLMLLNSHSMCAQQTSAGVGNGGVCRPSDIAMKVLASCKEAMRAMAAAGLGAANGIDDTSCFYDDWASLWLKVGVACLTNHQDRVTAERLMLAALRISSRDDAGGGGGMQTEMRNQLGALYSSQNNHPRALAMFRASAARDPSLAVVGNLGLAYRNAFLADNEVKVMLPVLHRYEFEAVADVGAGMGGERGLESAHWRGLLARTVEAMMDVCGKWEEMDWAMTALRQATAYEIQNNLTLSVLAFQAATFPFTAEEVRDITAAHARNLRASIKQYGQLLSHMIPLPLTSNGGRLRVAFVGAHFSKRRFMNGAFLSVWGNIDRTRTELFALAFDAHHAADDAEDRAWIAQSVEHFVAVQSRNEMEVAYQVQQMRVHIMVEMTGWYPERLGGVVVHKPAPLQLLYRYPSTGGGRGDHMFVGDQISTPPEHATHFVEKLLLMPRCYLVCSHRGQSFGLGADENKLSSRVKLQLPLGTFLLGALNRYYKFNAELMGLWCDAIRGRNAALVFIRYRFFTQAEGNLRAFARARKIPDSQIIFVEEGGPAKFYTIAAAIDLYLDGIPPLVNGHTAASDVMWAGGAVLTAPGTRMTERVASSLLVWSGSSQHALIARNAEDYAAILNRIVHVSHIPREIIVTDRSYHTHLNPVYDVKMWTLQFERSLRAAYETQGRKGVVMHDDDVK